VLDEKRCTVTDSLSNCIDYITQVRRDFSVNSHFELAMTLDEELIDYLGNCCSNIVNVVLEDYIRVAIDKYHTGKQQNGDFIHLHCLFIGVHNFTISNFFSPFYQVTHITEFSISEFIVDAFNLNFLKSVESTLSVDLIGFQRICCSRVMEKVV
jgi:hypothetical protein